MQWRGSGPRRHSARFRAPSGAPAPLSPPLRFGEISGMRRAARVASLRRVVSAWCLSSGAAAPRGFLRTSRPSAPAGFARVGRPLGRAPPAACRPRPAPRLSVQPSARSLRRASSGLSYPRCRFGPLSARLRASSGRPCAAPRGPLLLRAVAGSPLASFGRRGFQPRGQARSARLFGLGPGAFGGYRPPCSAGAPPFSARMGFVYASSRNQPPTTIRFHLSTTPATAGIWSCTRYLNSAN